MGILRTLFGPNREEIWRQLASSIDAKFVDGGSWRGDKIVAHTGEWTVTLDEFTRTDETDEDTSSWKTCTRMRAPFVNADGLRFEVCRTGLFTGLGKLLGMQDVEIGSEPFDSDFVIKGNDERAIRALLDCDRIRDLLKAQPSAHFSVKDDEGWFGAAFPEGVDELYFEAPGSVTDPRILHGLFDLFAETLQRLCAIGSAYEEDPGVVL